MTMPPPNPGDLWMPAPDHDAPLTAFEPSDNETSPADPFASEPQNLPRDESEEVYEEAPKLERRQSRRVLKTKSSAKPPKNAVAGVPVGDRVVALVPAMTNFDFLEGSYQKVRQTRLMLEGVLGLIVALVLGVGLLGLSASLSAQGAQAQIAATNAKVTADNSTYGIQTGFRGPHGEVISGPQLESHVAQRTQALADVLAFSPNVNTVFSRVYALGTNGVTIISVSISPAAAPAPLPTTTVFGQTTVVTTPTTLAPGAVTTTTIPPLSSATVTIVALVHNYNVYTTLVSEVQHMGKFVSNVSAVPSGGVPAITVTITASISNLPLSAPSLFTASGGKVTP